MNESMFERQHAQTTSRVTYTHNTPSAIGDGVARKIKHNRMNGRKRAIEKFVMFLRRGSLRDDRLQSIWW